MPIQLLVTNIAMIFCGIIQLGLGIFVYMRRPKEKASVNVIFLFFSIATVIWLASYGLGINIVDPYWSRFAFMFNLSTLYLTILTAHLILALTDRLDKQIRVLKILYATATAIIIFFAFFPDTFLLPSVQKLYLNNFFVLGSLYSLQDLFFYGVTIYFLYHMVVGYHYADYAGKNRLKYLILGLLYGYGVSFTAAAVQYDLPIDPMPAAFTGLYTIPMAYAILKYDAIDITVFAKRALGYALSIVGVTILILFTSYANEAVHEFLPRFPYWILPLVSAVIAVLVGVFVWNKVREVDTLKYRFVDVVTHKFRTPLTYIRWSLETLRTSTDQTERTHAVDAIASAHIRLSELTDALVGLSGSETSQFMYAYSPEKVETIVSDVLSIVSERIREKNITIESHLPPHLSQVSVDHKKIQFVVQMAIENAVIYSPSGSKVTISAEEKGDFITMSVKDSGIGIAHEDMSRLFSKFFRSSDAVHSHTEGLGIGLYLSRAIARRHGGDMWAESDGLGKGSTFFVKIPVVREAAITLPTPHLTQNTTMV